MPAYCKSCSAPIEWTTTEKNGKKMPVDEMPDPEGKWWVDPDGVSHYGLEDIPPDERRNSHFSTCEFAAQHRKKR